MRTFSDILQSALAAALALLLAILVLLAAFETLAWAFFELSHAEVSEIAGILMIWFGLLAAAWVVKLGLHLRLELVTDRLPDRFRAVVHCFAALAVALFGALLAWYGLALARTVSNTLPATGVEASVQYFPAAVAGVLIAFFAVEEVLFGPPEADAE